jgi:hypothetical protein
MFDEVVNNLIKAMKKKKGVKKKVTPPTEKETNTSTGMAPVLRNTKKYESTVLKSVADIMQGHNLRVRESVKVLTSKEATSASLNSTSTEIAEGPMVKVVLISEGLGNRRNMNFYGPEAIASAPAIFEGKPCFIDHPSETEEKDIPERRVKDKIGYFKNVLNESIDGENCITGELHFDLTENGHQAYLKSCTALHYKNEFPNSNDEYVGLSINADGEWEQRTIQIGDEKLDVNYVTRFTNAMSCDIVTSPARGGRFLSLVESAAGVVIKQKKEVDSMKKGISESLKAAQTALKVADEEKDSKLKAKKIAEARKLFESFLKEAAMKAAEDESEDESKDKKESEDECDDKSKEEAKDKGMDKKEDESKEEPKEEAEDESKKKEDESDAEKEDEKVEAEGDSKDDKKDDGKDEDEDEDVIESKRIVITSLAKEAGLNLDEHQLGKISKLSLKEAKAEIVSLKKLKDSIVRDVLKSFDVPVSKFEKMSESERKDYESKNNDLFSNCYK